jgi:hypothetical protein
MSKLAVSITEKQVRRGGPLFMVSELLKHHGVEIDVFSQEPLSNIVLAHNRFDKVRRSKRNVVFMGGYKWIRSGNGMNADHVVFQSEFFKKICLSARKPKTYSVINVLGGMPSDQGRMHPIECARPTPGPVRFVCCAKWWKRDFKRLRQTQYLFTKFLRRVYRGASLHVLGMNIPKMRSSRGVIQYPKSFHRGDQSDVIRKAHVMLMLSPFDTGPMVLTEAMHYRVPFVCSNNCAGSELIDSVDGVCGKVVKIDPSISSHWRLKRFRPTRSKAFYDKELKYDKIVAATREIVGDFTHYTSWKWTPEFNYESQAAKWIEVLGG